jgi:YVTN family beta-propeller protein
VANSFSNTIDIIDPASESVVAQMEVAAGPTSFVEDVNGKTWLLSNSWLSGSALSQLDLSTEEVIKSFTIGGSAKSLQINPAKDQLSYLSAPFGADASVYMVSIDATEDSSEAVISASNLYGMGIHPVTGEIFLANHNGFQGNGTGLIYSGDQLKSTFATGVGPNGFVFR